MSPTKRSLESRERMIWGDVVSNVETKDIAPRGRHSTHGNEINHDDDELEIQEVTPPTGYRRYTYPSRYIVGDKRVSVSRYSLSSPHSQISTPKQRPRGADAGKSIHKAAEAAQTSPPSSIPLAQDHRRSLGSAKRIIPAVLLPTEDAFTVPKLPLARKKVPVTPRHRHSGSQKRKAEPQLGKGAPSTSIAEAFSRKSIAEQAETLSVGEPSGSSLLGYVARQNAVAGSSRSTLSLGLSTSDRDFLQVARKSAYRMAVNSAKHANRNEEVLHSQPIKAARKTSAQHPSSSGSGWPEDSQEEGSDSDGEPSLLDSLSSYSSDVEEDISNRIPPGVETKDRGGLWGSSQRKNSISPSDNSDASEARSRGGFFHEDTTQRSNNAPGGAADLRVRNSDYFSRSRSRNIDSIVSSVHLASALPSIDISTSPPETEVLQPPSGRQSPQSLDVDREVDPPRPLVVAFEALSLYTLHLHQTNRLPFLLRNVRRSFKVWCHKLQIDSDTGFASEPPRQLPLRYAYATTSGEVYTYDTLARERECPLCSIFRMFPSWEALGKHLRWDHGEVEFTMMRDDNLQGEVYSTIVRMREKGSAPSPPTIPLSRKLDQVLMAETVAQNVGTLEGEVVLDLHHDPEPIGRITLPPQRHYPNRTRSPSPTSTTSHRMTSSKVPLESSLESHQPNARDPDADPEPSIHSSPHSSPHSVVPQLSTHVTLPSRSLSPPPMSALHGAARPISANPDSCLSGAQPTTYRPTGPHLYDHLSVLPLDIFEHRSWFVLDKEEEIFELTDVLDEDKVMCALWGRWILLNRSAFIANYFAGVEAFVDEYWLTMHQAAGWGALRAWLMMLVSRRFLKNTEMVQVLKKYNGRVGKNRRHKNTAPVL